LTLPSTIAIDGPAAAGKSTVAQRLAAWLGYLYFDTGVMYRAVTLAALEQGLDIAGEAGMNHLAKTLTMDVQPPTADDGRQYTVLLNGRDVTWEIRRSEVDACVSTVSAHPKVRQVLSARQREMGQRGRVVMVGRDIGTVVLPDADLKIYLDASVEERAQRRTLERREQGQPANYEGILERMRERDELDSRRPVAPMQPAADAVRVDTTGLTEEEVFDLIVGVVLSGRENLSDSP